MAPPVAAVTLSEAAENLLFCDDKIDCDEPTFRAMLWRLR
jgi:hypothetical protein